MEELTRYKIRGASELEGLFLVVSSIIFLTIAFMWRVVMGPDAVFSIGLTCLIIVGIISTAVSCLYEQMSDIVFMACKGMEKSMIIVGYVFFLIHMKEWIAGLII
nr:MAG TPA: hypothetical protein [Caudoviricetes sp.]